MELTLAPHASTFAAPSQSFLGLLSRSAAVYIVDVHVEIERTRGSELDSRSRSEIQIENLKSEIWQGKLKSQSPSSPEG
jgi:hypothetical protein